MPKQKEDKGRELPGGPIWVLHFRNNFAHPGFYAPFSGYVLSSTTYLLPWSWEPAMPTYPGPYTYSHSHSCPPAWLIRTTGSPGISHRLDFSPDASPLLCSVFPLTDLNEVISTIHHLQISFGYLGIAFYVYFLFT